ncbi:MAG: NAD(P)-dependent oxidoreductase [Candidatus Woesearchaeota archaeon]|jgi:dTDP-4-dehydrorhamnose reductase|nr:MAG: NAD(P)-dependent oxidoreductase [Candidatus Woesearchaeota archaeon]
MNILVLGDGLLGNEIIRQTKWNYISRKKDGIEARDFKTLIPFLEKENPDVILNAIAYTSTYNMTEEGKILHWDTNYVFVIHLANWCNSKNIKLVQISTDYLYANSKINAKETDVPVHANNWYSYTKLLSDAYCQLFEKNLIIRTSFKKKPFPYKKVFQMVGNFDYVDKIATLIIWLVKKNAKGVYNVGTRTKSMYELAKRTNPESYEEFFLIHESMPSNITMNLDKLRKELSIDW